ncbi:MAG: hypothetical protein M3142_01715 [Bacteroidota bacterium]|nr:hypothetical protein [Bacteroidota bacterium]
MKKLFVIGAVCIVGFSSCRSMPCPAYSKADTAKTPSHMVKAHSAVDKNRI